MNGGLRVLVANGPGLRVHEQGLTEHCRAWGAQLGVDAWLETCPSEDALRSRLAGAAAESIDALVVNPGLAPTEAVRHTVAAAGLPAVWVDVRSAELPRDGIRSNPDLASVCGRGIGGYRWALHHVVQRRSSPPIPIAYGPERDQFADLRLPSDGTAPHPVVVVVHGGAWREQWERDTTEPLAIDLARRGYATWNIEYRRVGPYGGGWPTTCEDVSAAIERLADVATEHALDLERVALVGHSAGGHLACWAVRRTGIATTGTRVSPRFVVSVAGVLDLEQLGQRGRATGSNSVVAFMRGWPEEKPDAYAAASPASCLPLGVPQVVAIGDRDDHDLVDLCRLYADSARAAGDDAELMLFAGADHFSIIDPSSTAWQAIAERIEQLMSAGRQR